MNKIEAFHKISDNIQHFNISDAEVTVVWDAFMARVNIGMPEPRTSNWTPGQFAIWNCLWNSDLNPFYEQKPPGDNEK